MRVLLTLMFSGLLAVLAACEGSPTTPTATPLPTAAPTATDDPADWLDAATAVAVGEPVAGVVDYPFEGDVFSFNAQAGATYEITVVKNDDTQWSVVAAIYDDERYQLAEGYSDGIYSPARTARIVWGAPETSTFYVQAHGFDEGTGPYTLTVSQLADDHANRLEFASPVAVSEPVDGVNEVVGDVDYFSFEAVIEQTYVVDFTHDMTRDMWALVFDADGEVAAVTRVQDPGLRPRLVEAGYIWWPIGFRASESGTFYVEVAHRWDAGPYTLLISEVNDDHANHHESATPLRVGKSVEGRLNYDGDIDHFSFEASAGLTYETVVSLGTLVDAQTEVYEAAGREWSWSDTAGKPAVILATESGAVFVEVSSYDGVGSYTITVEVR